MCEAALSVVFAAELVPMAFLQCVLVHDQTNKKVP